MRIPRRPQELRTTLPEHAELPEAERPVFVYAFPTPAEEVDLLQESVGSLTGDPEALERLRSFTDRQEAAQEAQRMLLQGELRRDTSYGQFLVEVFDRFIVRIENLEVGDDPFDREEHLLEVPGSWKMQVGRELYGRMESYLTEAEEGNSSSPRSSAETTSSATGAAAVESAV